jgi:hypothetical protein
MVVDKYEENVWLLRSLNFFSDAREKDDANEKESGKVEDFIHKDKVGVGTI